MMREIRGQGLETEGELEQKSIGIFAAVGLIIELISSRHHDAGCEPVVRTEGPALFIETDRRDCLVEPVIAHNSLDIPEETVELGRTVGNLGVATAARVVEILRTISQIRIGRIGNIADMRPN